MQSTGPPFLRTAASSRCSFGRVSLAAWAEVGQPRVFALRSNSNGASTSRTGTPASAVDGVALAGNRRHEIATHEVPRRRIEAAQPFFIHFRGRAPWVKPLNPERLALIDVADAGADALIKQQFTKPRGSADSNPPDDLVEIKRISEDVGSQVRERQSRVGYQFHDRRSEADCDHIVEGEHGCGTALGLAPPLSSPVQVPRTMHAHMGVQRDPAFELHHEMLAVRLDAFKPARAQARDRLRPGIDHDLAGQALTECGRRAPDRVALRQGPAGAPARGRRLSAWSQILHHEAGLPKANL